jgi:hypothetical protein
MRMKQVLSAGFGALALGLIATSAQAAPVGGLSAAAQSGTTDAGLVEKVHWYGHRYGWHYGYKPYYYGHYGYYRPYYRWHKPYGWRYGPYHHWY